MENVKLKMELEALRRAKGGGSQATWSWMEVSEGFPRGKMQTRRHESKMDWEVVRFTPNSAQIPPPPLETSLSVQMLAWDLQAYDIIGSETSYEVVGATTTTSGREAAWEGGPECRGRDKISGRAVGNTDMYKKKKKKKKQNGMEWNGRVDGTQQTENQGVIFASRLGSSEARPSVKNTSRITATWLSGFRLNARDGGAQGDPAWSFTVPVGDRGVEDRSKTEHPYNDEEKTGNEGQRRERDAYREEDNLKSIQC